MTKMINFNREIDTAIVGDNNTVNIINKKTIRKDEKISLIRNGGMHCSGILFL